MESSQPLLIKEYIMLKKTLIGMLVAAVVGGIAKFVYTVLKDEVTA